MRAWLVAVLILFTGALPAAADAPTDFSNWAVVVIAGDWRSHGGGDTEAFDNARRDVAEELGKAGFNPANILQYSLRPPRKGDPAGLVVTPQVAVNSFADLTGKAQGGCLFYVTSHGNQEGAVFGPSLMLTPAMLHRLLDQVCAGRPAIAVVSACFSGVFVPELAAPDHVVMTAARDDRSSFGCSDKDKYPYFDACMLESLPKGGDFLILSKRVKACVARKEGELNIAAQNLPPSEPQTFVGGQAQLWLPFLRLKPFTAPQGTP